jgi:hypothetical protein
MLHCVTDRSNICGMRSVTPIFAHLETEWHWFLRDAFHKTAVGHTESCEVTLGRVKMLGGTFDCKYDILYGLQRRSGLERLDLSKVK